MALTQVHVITPGDHYSPGTGSAVPTVVHGLAGATPPGRARPAVVVARGTYPDRYDSADVIEYAERPQHRRDRYVDAATGRLGLGRPRSRRRYAATVVDQRSWAPAVVLAHNAPQLVPSVDTARHVPVLYAHNELLRTYSRREAGRTLAAAGAVVCVSGYLAGQTAERLPAALRDRVAVVHNGVDAAFFHPGDASRHDDDLHVVFVGRTLPDKGPDVLLAALARLGRRDVRATVAGTVGFAPGAPLSGYERSLRRASAPVAHRVTWLPFQDRGSVAALLRTADVVVVPSRWPEPFALTVLEGMASGAAVVASDVGGIPEAAGDAGVLVPPDDPGALADVIEGWADDRAALARVQAAGRAHAEAHDWSAVRAALDAVLAPLGADGAPSVRAATWP